MNGSLTVRCNTIDWTIDPTVNVKRAIVHKKFNETIDDYDIGLLITASRIKKGINCKPIKISEKEPKPDSTVTLSG